MATRIKGLRNRKYEESILRHIKIGLHQTHDIRYRRLLIACEIKRIKRPRVVHSEQEMFNKNVPEIFDPSYFVIN